VEEAADLGTLLFRVITKIWGYSLDSSDR